jgi:pilus assembly protein CpaC
MTKDKILFMFSFALLGLMAAYLLSQTNAPAPVPVLQVQEKPEGVKPIEMLPLVEGKIAVPFQLTTRSAVIQFLQPGTRVDVRFTSKKNLGLDAISLIFLNDIRILAIGKDAEGRIFNEKGTFYKANTPVEILLEMTPEQSELLSYAELYGDISFEIIEKNSSYQPDELTEKLLKSRSDDNFKSILVSHMVQSLFPGSDIKITAIDNGYIVSGTVADDQVAGKIIQILDLMTPQGNKGVVNLLQYPKLVNKLPPEPKIQLHLAPGRGAVSIEMNARSPIIPFLHPNTMVDIKFTSKADIGFTPLSLTLFKNIKVVAIRPIGALEFVNENKQVGSEPLLEVLLEMTPKEAEILSYAQASGMISFELSGRNLSCQNEMLADSLMNSDSVSNFQSILMTFMVRSIFPSVDVKIFATPRGFIVRGHVPDPQMASKIIEIFTKLVPGGERAVINMLKVRPQQVLLCVKFFELGKNVLQRVGINWEVLLQTGSKMLAFGAYFPPPPISEPNFFVNGNATTGNFNLSAMINMLEEDADTRVLAEPNLTTISGETAHFFAGGQFPILIPQGGTLLGTVTVEYKKYGVSLDFTPTVDLNDLITLHVIPEVSDIDRANSVVLSGFIIPGLRTRRVDTTVKLWPGQTYLIAGMFLDELVNTNDNLYGLNKIPFIGSIFSSNRYQDNRKELMIMVTPYLIRDEGDEYDYIQEADEQTEDLIQGNMTVFDCEPEMEPIEYIQTPWETIESLDYDQEVGL